MSEKLSNNLKNDYLIYSLNIILRIYCIQEFFKIFKKEIKKFQILVIFLIKQ
jgi:uncharacterized transporter YbjL